MSLIDKLAEQHILAAVEAGEFENLPGHGKPQVLDDDSMVPENLRAGYRLLKNAGFLPPQMQLQREIADVEALLRAVDGPEARERAQRRLRLLQSQLVQYRGEGVDIAGERGYRDRILGILE